LTVLLSGTWWKLILDPGIAVDVDRHPRVELLEPAGRVDIEPDAVPALEYRHVKAHRLSRPGW